MYIYNKQNYTVNYTVKYLALHKARYFMFTSVRFVTKLFAAIYILYTIEPAHVVCCLS